MEKLMIKYQNLYERAKYCMDKYFETKDIKYAMEEDCISHMFECEGLKTYEKIANFAKENGFSKVFDIGCAIGHQSEVFLQSGLDYVGIEEAPVSEFWNADKFTYISKKYPFKIIAEPNKDLAVSVLCLTWNCYLYEKEKTLQEQCEALQRDFKHCLLYMPKEAVSFVSKYYKGCKNIEGHLYYFFN